MQDLISSARVAEANVSTRTAAMCLGPEAGGNRELPRKEPAADEIEIAVEAAAVNPIDVRRAAGYGRRLLSLMGAARFPLTLGNDFAGTVVRVGARATDFKVGERVYGGAGPPAISAKKRAAIQSVPDPSYTPLGRG
jgi:reticulon-4-interacting protein 1, mitochondrial